MYTETLDSLDASAMITAYMATLDTKTLDDSITNLTGSPSVALWGEYAAALNDILCDRGSSDTWPSILKSKFATLLHFAEAARLDSLAVTTKNDISAQEADEVEVFTTDTGFPQGLSPDVGFKLSALMVVHQHHPRAAEIWYNRLYREDMGLIHDPVTYRTGMYYHLLVSSYRQRC